MSYIHTYILACLLLLLLTRSHFGTKPAQNPRCVRLIAMHRICGTCGRELYSPWCAACDPAQAFGEESEEGEESEAYDESEGEEDEKSLVEVIESGEGEEDEKGEESLVEVMEGGKDDENLVEVMEQQQQGCRP